MKKVFLSTAALLLVAGVVWWLLQAPREAGKAQVDPASSTDGSKSPNAATAPVVESADAEKRAGPQIATGVEKAQLPQAAARQKSILDTEFRLIRANALSLQPTQELLKSKDFEKFVRSLGQEAAGDNEAQDQTSAYQNAAQEMLREVGGVTKLSNFACGLSLCVGSVREGSAIYGAWREKLLSSKRLKFYSLVDDRVELDRQTVEHRFVISIDPSIKGILAPPQRPSTANR